MDPYLIHIGLFGLILWLVVGMISIGRDVWAFSITTLPTSFFFALLEREFEYSLLTQDKNDGFR